MKPARWGVKIEYATTGARVWGSVVAHVFTEESATPVCKTPVEGSPGVLYEGPSAEHCAVCGDLLATATWSVTSFGKKSLWIARRVDHQPVRAMLEPPVEGFADNEAEAFEHALEAIAKLVPAGTPTRVLRMGESEAQGVARERRAEARAKKVSTTSGVQPNASERIDRLARLDACAMGIADDIPRVTGGCRPIHLRRPSSPRARTRRRKVGSMSGTCYAVRALSEGRARWELRGAVRAAWAGYGGVIACLACGEPSEGMRMLDGLTGNVSSDPRKSSRGPSFAAVGLCAICNLHAAHASIERAFAWAVRRKTIVVSDLTITWKGVAA